MSESAKRFLKADLFLYKIIKKKTHHRCRIQFCAPGEKGVRKAMGTG